MVTSQAEPNGTSIRTSSPKQQTTQNELFEDASVDHTVYCEHADSQVRTQQSMHEVDFRGGFRSQPGAGSRVRKGAKLTLAG